MTDDGQSAEWDEVGRRFGELGRRLQAAWADSRPERAAEEAEEGGRHTKAAFEDLKQSITRTVSNPGVRSAAENATSGFTDALAANLRQLAEWVERKPSGPSGGASGDTVDGPPTP